MSSLLYLINTDAGRLLYISSLQNRNLVKANPSLLTVFDQNVIEKGWQCAAAYPQLKILCVHFCLYKAGDEINPKKWDPHILVPNSRSLTKKRGVRPR